MSALPQIDQRRLSLFTRYVGWYLQRNFHRIHLLRQCDLAQLEGWPLLVCVNHPSWWDPLVCAFLARRSFPERVHYAPIDSEAVRKYEFFLRLGFFPVSSGITGATRFLRVAKQLLSNQNGTLWVTPQGKFTDVRRPVELTAGVAHIPKQTQRFVILPIALEYAFWNERYPEAFICLGEPLFVNGQKKSTTEWRRIFANQLQRTQQVLSDRVVTRDGSLFEPLLLGRSGVGGTYDLWRAVRSWVQGRRFQPRHESV